MSLDENDRVCGRDDCRHTFYDHEGRFTPAERERIVKTRKAGIGCWVARCGCQGFMAAVARDWSFDYE